MASGATSKKAHVTPYYIDRTPISTGGLRSSWIRILVWWVLYDTPEQRTSTLGEGDDGRTTAGDFYKTDEDRGFDGIMARESYEMAKDNVFDGTGESCETDHK